jgi:hypothetical protein
MTHDGESFASGPPLERSEKIRILELTVRLSENESDRLWKRFTVLLTVNSLFVALLKFSPL